MNKSESIDKLAKSLCEAQKEMPVASKTSDNPYFKSKYADLAQIIELSTPILTKNGLSISQFPISVENRAGVRTYLMHESGQFIEDEVLFNTKGTTAQDMASGITYARRYAWQSIIGMAADIDDDGNNASGRNKKEEDFISITKEDDRNAALARIKDFMKRSGCPKDFIIQQYAPSGFTGTSITDFPDDLVNELGDLKTLSKLEKRWKEAEASK